MVVIECLNVSRKFGSYVAVNDLSLKVEQGELYGFLGPNGAGKTTTIKMLTGLLRPTSGSCIIAGFNMQTEPLKARSALGYVPDNPFLYDRLSGREYLQFMAELYNVSRDGLEAKINNLLNLLELEDKSKELIQSYSRGMRQKIALAGALVHNPSALFLDEPTVGLDPRGARVMQEILRELCRRGAAVFITTHQMSVAEKLCDRISIINGGQIVAEGTPQSLLTEHSGYEGRTLEELFLHLTGAPEQEDLLRFLE